MSTLSSAEFRKTYAKLTEATTVTVNGHPIGQWVPVNAAGVVVTEDQLRVALSEVVDPYLRPGEATKDDAPDIIEHVRGFNTRPFTPVPKTRK